MRCLLAVLLIPAIATITGCQSNTKQPETETPKKDTMAAAPVDTTNRLSAAEQSAGWQLLFDGTTNNSFHVFNNKSDGSAWKVTDGNLHLDTANKKDGHITGGGDLVTNDEYENFDLK